MSNIMLDLETMGTGPDAAIVAIGAVVFSSTGTYDEFYTAVDLGSSMAAGMTVDASTVMWWLEQSEEARRALKGGVPLKEALRDFTAFYYDNQGTYIWGNGANFDNVILASAYRKFGENAPWKFYEDRCYRTVRELLGQTIKINRDGTAHNALDDARCQADHLVRILNAITQGEG